MDIEILDLSVRKCVDTEKKNPNKELPYDMRGVIIGKSGSGKTNLCLNMLLQDGLRDYNNLVIVGNSLFQEEYQILKALEDYSKDVVKELILSGRKNYDPMEVMSWLKDAKNIKKTDNPIKVSFYTPTEAIDLDPNDYDINDNNYIIFDDIYGEKSMKKVCDRFYTRGRHINFDCIYLSQNYFVLSRSTVRENSNLFILFEQDGKNINHIYRDRVGEQDMSFTKFRKLCTDIWRKKFNFLTIDLTKDKETGKYKHNFKPIKNL